MKSKLFFGVATEAACVGNVHRLMIDSKQFISAAKYIFDQFYRYVNTAHNPQQWQWMPFLRIPALNRWYGVYIALFWAGYRGFNENSEKSASKMNNVRYNMARMTLNLINIYHTRSNAMDCRLVMLLVILSFVFIFQLHFCPRSHSIRSSDRKYEKWHHWNNCAVSSASHIHWNCVWIYKTICSTDYLTMRLNFVFGVLADKYNARIYCVWVTWCVWVCLFVT